MTASGGAACRISRSEVEDSFERGCVSRLAAIFVGLNWTSEKDLESDSNLDLGDSLGLDKK